MEEVSGSVTASHGKSYTNARPNKKNGAKYLYKYTVFTPFVERCFHARELGAEAAAARPCAFIPSCAA
ncbi:hypothetical protein F3J20_27495 [Paraburkholderia sp. Cy-641]|uniref:hypothetical protein n=1 Tax=Paraburkholderia sp. Cy-641 TaxID=2608337 RepID=UPI00141FB3BE|nr:hypothetical protein [Paraburkholderia sp. Cy-641]NIF81078.1 hypothetical protein [Paraburkholderia sp. Cy-641]